MSATQAKMLLRMFKCDSSFSAHSVSPKVLLPVVWRTTVCQDEVLALQEQVIKIQKNVPAPKVSGHAGSQETPAKRNRIQSKLVFFATMHLVFLSEGYAFSHVIGLKLMYCAVRTCMS